ncbi:MAG: PD40 domain-containing protein, partial [Thermoplasmata archaeon]|nr:PD40 domain-containing protein [Thermoplasmata archaeon]
ARDKDAAWSPDGRTIAYLSDKRGEYEIYLVDPMGNEEAIRLTQHEDGYRHTLCWSPDSKKIAFADHTLRCYFVDVDSKKITEVDRAEYENIDVSLDVKPIYDFAWSPDSRYIAYSKMDGNLVFKVHIYSLDSGEIHCVSKGIFNDFHPVFTEDGKHLIFISNRRFSPTLCDFEWEMVYKRVAGIYCLTLEKDGAPLLPFESDEEEIKEEDAEKDKKDDGNGEEDVQVKIDFDGISARIESLPLPRGNYRHLLVNESALFYLNKDEGDFNRFEFRNIGSMDLYRFSFEEREEETVIEGIRGYALSADGKSIVYRQQNSIGIIKASDKESGGKSLDLSDLKMHLDPKQEWKQIFNEAWRMERDFYYEPSMHGLDWDAMKEKYGKLVPFASCRQDMRFIIGELIGE